MPRIDPLDLLKCLGVLLSPSGGIKGAVEVERVARLMLRFSKKLVSKCIYIHVLKATPSELLDAFFNEHGAWYMVHTWLIESLQSRNTPLLVEVLELLQLCPVSEVRLKDSDVTNLIQNRLKYTDLAHMIQSIAQEYNDQNCRNLATQIWSRWFAKPADPHDFTLTQEDTPSILPDLDLSIYAPDASASSYGDPMAAMNNLSTLDMSSYQYLETNDFYGMSHVEPVAAMNSFIPDTTGYSANQQQMPMHMNSVQMSSTTNWTSTPQSMTVDPAVVTNPTQLLAETPALAPVVDETKLGDGNTIGGLPVLKIKVSKEGQPYVVNTDVVNDEAQPAVTAEPVKETKSSSKDKVKDKKKEKPESKKSSSSSSSSSRSKDDSAKKSSSSDSKKKDKDKSSSRSSSSSSKDDRRSSSSSGKDRSSKSKSSSKEGDKAKPTVKSPSKEEKQAEKNRETLAVIKSLSAPASVKIAKIPRKPKQEGDVSTEGAVLQSSSTTAPTAAEVVEKLATQQRPKTVKTFNSKFRSTGLVEPIPAPGKPGVAVKKPGVASPSSSPVHGDKKIPGLKRPGSSDGLPLEKKHKAIDDSAISAAVAAVMKKTAAAEAKPAVKLIAPRPRPLLQECSLFMDALEAGAKAPTEPKKRKRSLSSSNKEGEPSSSPTLVPTKPTADAPTVTSPQIKTEPTASDASPSTVKPMFKFYQDTLETEEPVKEEKPEIKSEPAEVKKEAEDENPKEGGAGSGGNTPLDEGAEDTNSGDATVVKTEGSSSPSSQRSDEDGASKDKPRGVLVIHSQMKNRKKKSVRWRAEEDLEMHHFFELDETERVNVNKLLFGEMKQAEREREKHAFQMSKQMVEEPEPEEKPWILPPLIWFPEDHTVPAVNSREAQIQADRENATLQALYFKGQILPDSPLEPDPEVPLERMDAPPTEIPLDDVTGNPENVYDHRSQPWPEPKTLMYSAIPPLQPHIPLNHHQQHPYPPQQQLQHQFPNGPGNMPPFRHQQHGAGPMDEPYHDSFGPGEIQQHPHHHGPPGFHPRGGHGGPPHRGGGGGGDGGGTWMAGDGSVYPDPDVARYDGPLQHRDGPPHHRDNFHHRDRESNRGHGYNDSGYNQGYMAPRGMGMDGPPRGPRGPRFHGPPRGGPRGGPPGGGPSSQPCWHYMRGFCRLESRCKFLHTGQPGSFNNSNNGALMP